VAGGSALTLNVETFSIYRRSRIAVIMFTLTGIQVCKGRPAVADYVAIQ
jgi:hypothetical protein